MSRPSIRVVTVRQEGNVFQSVYVDPKIKEARKDGNAQVVQQTKATVTIEDIDSQGLTVTYRTSDNRKMLRQVNDKRLLAGLHRGDRVEVTMSRERAISIECGR